MSMKREETIRNIIELLEKCGLKPNQLDKI